MTFYDGIANHIQSTYKYEKTQGFWARLLYMSPAQRVQRLNEVFDTDKFDPDVSNTENRLAKQHQLSTKKK